MMAEKNRNNSESWMVWILLTALLLSLVPLVILGLYAAPANDDYSFSADSHLRYEETGRMADAVQEAWEQARSSYYNWQGTFSAIFLMALQPAVFDFTLYRITALLMLAAFLGGTFFLCYVLFSEVFRESKQFAVCVASIVSLVGLQLMPSPAEGLYWFNGAVYYTFFYGLSLLAIAGIIRILGNESFSPS